MTASFGAILRRLRIAENLSQEALAERARVSAAAIGAYERGVRNAPHRGSVELLADALQLSGDVRREFEVAARRKSRARRSRADDPSPSPASRGLPRELSSFVGREAEIAEISALLSSQRVVTITGAGGVGKTRVALQAASRQKRADGVWFVDLGSVRDPARVVAKILSVVPVPSLGGDESPEALADFFHDRSMLLVLDNCEHVMEAASDVVVALVRGAPEVDVLVTSRHRFRISSESVYRLSPLPYPDARTLPAAEARQFAAIELFVSRAATADRSFVFTDAEVDAVVEICRQVEGIPLAVELAAARLATLGLTALKARLRDRLGPLVANVRDAPERQQTLRITINWSYELLSTPERLLLQRLAIFSGGCTLDAAEDVCSDASLTRSEVSDGLSMLVDRSLVTADITSNVPRYTLLESTRQFALEKLSEPERIQIAARHAAWCAKFADEIRLTTHELSHAQWASIVLPEFDNIYAAIDWTTQHDRLLFARIIGSLYFLWWRIGRLEEGRRFAVDALSKLDEDAYPAVAAQLHVARSVSLSGERKVDAVKRAVQLFERLGEPYGLSDAYLHLGGAYLMMQDRENLYTVVERVSSLVRRTKEDGLYPLISWLRAGIHTLDGKVAEAREELLIALTALNISDQEARYEISHQLASVEFMLGNTERAAALSDELVAAARQQRMANQEMYALVKSAGYHILLADTERAEVAARDALLAARGLNSTILTSAIEQLATIAALRGNSVKAARLHGYVDAWFLREEHNYVNLPAACRERRIEALEKRLTPADMARHIAAGAVMSEAAAVAEALQR